MAPETTWTAAEVIGELRALGSGKNVEGMARFGISPQGTLGVPVPAQRALATRIGTDHKLAVELWKTGVHEGRQVAAMIEDPAKITRAQMDRWARDLDSWDVCDGCAFSLFWRTPFAYEKTLEWSTSPREYVKRAAFSTIAALAVHDKLAEDASMLRFLPVIRREAGDERNFVKKAVNRALRQIGKRNVRLNAAAIETAEAIRADGTRSGRWIAADALRELRSDAVQRRLQDHAARGSSARRKR